MTCPEHRDVISASTLSQMGIRKVAMCHSTPHATGWNICAHVWSCALLGSAAALWPLGSLWTGAKTVRCIPQPLYHSWIEEGRQAARSSIPTPPPHPHTQSLSMIHWHTTAMRKGGGSNGGVVGLAINVCHWPGPESSWQSPSLALTAHYCPYAKVPQLVHLPYTFIVQARKTGPPEQNGCCLPSGRCVQSCLSQTCSPGDPADNFLITSNCLITSKPTSKLLDRLLTQLKPRQPLPL